MPWRSRSLLLALLSVGYVLVAALRSSRGHDWGFLVLLASHLSSWSPGLAPHPLARRRLGEPGDPKRHARGLLRRCAARGRVDRSTRSRSFRCHCHHRNDGGLDGRAGRRRTHPPLGGLLAAAARSERLLAAGAVAIVGAFAAVVPSRRRLRRQPFLAARRGRNPGAGAAAFFLVVTIVATWHLRRVRRLDLGAAERLSAALTFAWVALVVGVPASLLRIAPASHVLSAAAWLVLSPPPGLFGP